MRKIPTVFVRDPEHLSRVTIVPHPDCGWVFAGEGAATRKHDGTCVRLDDAGQWWARATVRSTRRRPVGFVLVETDPVTETAVGWIPAGTSSWKRWLAEAAAHADDTGQLPGPGTYELIGPKVNGNNDRAPGHRIIRHADATRVHLPSLSYTGLRDTLTDLATAGYEGVVWHHPDGRMAKLKARDFR